MSTAPMSPSGDATTGPPTPVSCWVGEAPFVRLYDETSSRVYGLVRRIVRDPVLAEEVTREVFLRAWHAVPVGDQDPADAGWLMATAHRHAVDTVRAAETDPTPVVVRDPAVSAPAATPPTTLPDTPEARRVLRALAMLTHTQREVLELTYFGGYTHAEVAVLVGARLGTAQALAREGLHRLRGLLLEPA
ncbi:sigma-70 family RNA polymerase sigma factor [Nocardioides rubriscoriae]|uniref:sigma-70 family RNA polymerase sigma factor n=1 Tax=Nocardioides rubriscoriae TaxID=642762 RepID=UPI001478FF2A|nr:sigma-70 family RNA polymerase sigma factor [Nocardioides rubriscoriae]